MIRRSNQQHVLGLRQSKRVKQATAAPGTSPASASSSSSTSESKTPDEIVAAEDKKKHGSRPKEAFEDLMTQPGQKPPTLQSALDDARKRKRQTVRFDHVAKIAFSSNPFENLRMFPLLHCTVTLFCCF